MWMAQGPCRNCLLRSVPRTYLALRAIFSQTAQPELSALSSMSPTSPIVGAVPAAVEAANLEPGAFSTPMPVTVIDVPLAQVRYTRKSRMPAKGT